MSPFDWHKHTWEVVGTSRTKGRGMPTKVWGDGGERYDELVHGTTDISLRCATCGKPKLRRVIGQWEAKHEPVPESALHELD
jgi:hypothetical protein